MTTAANIVLADAQATPVNHTFVPIGRDSQNRFLFQDQSQSNEIGYWVISIEDKRPGPAKVGDTSKNRVSRVRVTLSEPVLEVLSNNSAGYTPAPTIAYTPKMVTEFILSERCSLQNRKDLRKMGMNLLNDAMVIAVVENRYLIQ